VVGVVAGVVADLDLIHRRTAAIPASNEVRNPPCPSSSIVSLRVLLLARWSINEDEDAEVTVEEEEVGASDGTYPEGGRFRLLAERRRDKELDRREGDSDGRLLLPEGFNAWGVVLKSTSSDCESPCIMTTTGPP
jgi:hypothetical protein